MIENCRRSRIERLLRRAGLAAALLVFPALMGAGAGSERIDLGFDLPDTSTRLPVFQKALGEAFGQAQDGEGLDLLAGLLYANGYLREARISYEHLRRAEPQEARWSYFLGIIDSELGETDGAILDFEQARKNAPDYLPTYLQLGNLLFKTGDLEQSEQSYRRVLRDRPNDVYARLGMARCQMARGALEEATETLQAAVGQEPRMTTTYALLAKAYSRLGRKDEAAQARQEVRNSPRYRNPADPWVEAINEYCYDLERLAVLADIERQSGNFDAAIRILQQAIRIDPASSVCLIALGSAYERTGQEEKAEAHFRKAISANPNDDEGYLRLSSLLMKAGDLDSALAVAEEGVRRKPDSTLIINQLGFVLAEKGRIEESERVFRGSLEIDPVNRFAIGKLGLLLFEQDADEGLPWLEQYIALQPDDHEVRFKLGDWYANRGQFEKALTYLEPAFRFEKENPELRKALSISHLRVGFDLAGEGKVPEAIGKLEKALAVDPDFGDALFNISLLYMEVGRAPEAIGPLTRYIGTNRNDVEAYFHLARALVLSSQFESAREVLNEGRSISRAQGGNPALEREMNALQKAIESQSRSAR